MTRNYTSKQRQDGAPGGVAAPERTRNAALPDLQVMLTAEEAFPYLEDMFLTARDRIAAGFRIMDPTTQLQSEAARRVGDRWADLVADTLARGVRVRIVLSDFDPVGAAQMHHTTHKSLRLYREAAERAGAAERLETVAALHPAEVGPLYRRLFTPMARQQLARLIDRLNRETPEDRSEWMKDAPGLARLLGTDEQGRILRSPERVQFLWPCTHHQKIAVADGRRLYVGGLDLDDRRADGIGHRKAPSRSWHDVQLGCTGPLAAAAEAHLDRFLDVVEGRRDPGPRQALLRTLSRRRSGLSRRLRLGPKPLVHEIYDRTVAEIARAEAFIYLESQFLRDLRIARALARRAREVKKLSLVVVLPAAPEDAAFLGDTSLGVRFGEHLQSRCVEKIAGAFGDRVAFVSPAQPRPVSSDGTRAVIHGAPIVYVHSKVSIFDERAAVVSSANLNGRSHRWDTEAGIALDAPEQVKLLRDRLMLHWLPEDADGRFFDPATAPRAWAGLAEANAAAPPIDRQGFVLPFPRKAPRRFGRPVPVLTQDLM
ncbi:phospholipase D family protein [Rhodosalinus sp.]|uniref:phospholipase D family protein n=1 Tax=Rhodosalinus sp. TaxID=2047741 RepID=UPI003979407D